MMTAEQLKNSILQLAMQGKLVEQRPEEGTGEELYREIQAEKKRLVKEGKVKKQKPLAEITEDEIPFEIPESWKWCRVSEIWDVLNGDRGKNYPAKSTLSKEGIPFISALNLDGTGVVEDDKLLCLSEEQYNRLSNGKLKQGDIVVCIRGSLGKHGRYPYKIGAIASSLVILRSHSESNELDDLLILYLDSPFFFDEIKKYDNGTAHPNLAAKSLEQFLIPLPPLEEQKRIVAKIEELMPFVDQYAAASTKLNTLNTSFPEMMKKSILQEAVQGKLVPQDPNDEPASVLLKKIAEEKKRLIKEGKIKKQKLLPEITEDEIPCEIPESWEWVRLGEIITDTEAGKSPKCKNRPANKSEWGVIKTTAVQDGYFLKDENKVLPDGFEIKESQIIHVDDLLITRAGPQNRTGITCIVDSEPGKLILSDKTVRLAYLKGLINHKFLMYVIKSPAIQNYISSTKSGMAASQVNIAQDKMKLFIIPLPPLNEQGRIVNFLDRVIPAIQVLCK